LIAAPSVTALALLFGSAATGVSSIVLAQSPNCAANTGSVPTAASACQGAAFPPRCGPRLNAAPGTGQLAFGGTGQPPFSGNGQLPQLPQLPAGGGMPAFGAFGGGGLP